MNFLDLERHHDSIAIITSDGQTLTYNDLSQKCNQFTKEITSSHRQLCFLLVANTTKSIINYIGLLKSNTPFLLLDKMIDPDLLQQLIDVYKPNLVISDEEIKKINSNKKDLFHQDLALLLSTSGSTGSPKLVRLSKQNIYSNAKSISEYLSLSDKDRAITTLPMYYSFGLSVINSHLLVGATILLTQESIISPQFWAFLKEKKATSLSGVPYIYEMLKRLRFLKMDLPYLKTLTQAGGRLSPTLAEEFSKKLSDQNKKFFIMYGQTEATARISYLDHLLASQHFTSIGKAIPGGKLKLMDENNNEIQKNNVVGELVYEGPNVMMGYAESKADLNKGDELHGILKTGDLAKRDALGLYYIVGRKKRFLKLNGIRVNLEDIDSYLATENIESFSFGEDNNLMIATTTKESTSTIKLFLSKKLGFHHSVFSIIEIDDFPRNKAGKILIENIHHLKRN